MSEVPLINYQADFIAEDVQERAADLLNVTIDTAADVNLQGDGTMSHDADPRRHVHWSSQQAMQIPTPPAVSHCM